MYIFPTHLLYRMIGTLEKAGIIAHHGFPLRLSNFVLADFESLRNSHAMCRLSLGLTFAHGSIGQIRGVFWRTPHQELTRLDLYEFDLRSLREQNRYGQREQPKELPHVLFFNTTAVKICS